MQLLESDVNKRYENSNIFWNIRISPVEIDYLRLSMQCNWNLLVCDRNNYFFQKLPKKNSKVFFLGD